MALTHTQIDMTDLGNQVRHWVFYDNLITSLNKDIHNTRVKRQQHENTIIHTLKSTHHEKAVLQIVGGRILLAEEKHTKPLTFTSLESMLTEYYRQKGSHNETDDIIKFIKGHRTLETTTRLKRQITDTAAAKR
jgi:hypothetical protein